jgi:5-methylcytosine-specific restriction endonuclease McrA
MSSWGRPRSKQVRAEHRRRFPPEQCNGCGATDVPLRQDHIINLAAGGTDTVDNMQWLCDPCHKPKTEHERKTAWQRKQRYRNQRRHLPVTPHPGD